MRIQNFQPKGVQASRETLHNLPNNHFVSIIYSSKGTGKTNLLINMVKDYDKTKFFQKVYLFSPSYGADPKYHHLNDGSYELKIYNDFSNDLFQEVMDEIQADLDEWNHYQYRLKLYDKLQKARSLKQFTQEDLFELDQMEYEKPTPPFPREPFSLIVFDDLASNQQLMKQGKSIVNSVLLRCRHYRTSFIYVVQQYRNAVPKMVRANSDLWILAKSKSQKDMEAVAEELTSYASLNDIVSMWDKATEGDYNYFVINLMAPANLKFTRNFDEPITA
jgi:hypothetical protein